MSQVFYYVEVKNPLVALQFLPFFPIIVTKYFCALDFHFFSILISGQYPQWKKKKH